MRRAARTLRIGVCSVVGVGCLAAPAWAAPPVVGAEKPASTPFYQPKPGSQHSSATAWNALAGKYLVVWVDDGTIRGELVSPAGARTSPSSVFAIPTGGAPFNVDVAVKGTHFFLIVWEQAGAVWGARVLDDTPVGSPFVISDAENQREQDARQGEPAVASNGTDFLVAWSDARRNSTLPANSFRDGFDIHAARVSGNIFAAPLMDPDGFAVAADGTTAQVPNTSPSQFFVQHDQVQPTVASDGANYLVAWSGQNPSAGVLHTRARFVTAAGATSGSIFAVSDTASPPERNPELAWNGANAVYFAVWTAGSGSGDILGARIDTSGSVLDAPAKVFADGPTNQDRARALVNGSNSYTIVWDDGADVYGLHAVRIAIIGPENWLVGPPNLVSGEAGNDTAPSLTTNGAPTGTPGPTLFVAWTAAGTGVDGNVHAKPVNVAGTPQGGGSPLVVSASAAPQDDPFLAWNGSYLAAWTERRPPASSTTHEIYRGRLNAAGDLQDGTGILTLDDVSNTIEPAAIARGATTFLVTWATDFDVYAQLLDAAGTPVGGPIPIYTDFLSTQPAPEVAWNGASYLVVWRHNPGTGQGVRGVRVSEGGTVLDGTPIVAGAGGNGVTAPRVASDGGNWLVTWGQLGAGTGTDVVARRVDRDGAPLGVAPTTVTSVADTQAPTGVAWDGDRFLIAWEDHRDAGSSTSDVYAGRVAEDGAPLDGTGFPVAVAPGGTGGQEAVVAANGKNFVVAWRTFDGNVRAVRVSGEGVVLDPGGVLVGGGGQALEWPAIAASSPGRVGIAYARTAPEIFYGGVGRVFVRFLDEDVLPAADTTPPSNPSLTSPSHQAGVASNDDTVVVDWTGAADGGSGVDGFSYVWSEDEDALPPAAKNAPAEAATATSPPLATGDWYFHLRTRDKAGNWNAGAVTIGPFAIDTMPPETTIESGPGGTTNVSFAFSSSEAGSTFACSLDGAPAEPCTSPTPYTGLAGGSHTFEVAAADAVGNVDPTPASETWLVPDTSPPALTLTAAASAKLGAVRKRGYAIRARCSEPCALVAELRIAAKLARRLKVGQVVAERRASLPALTTRSLTLVLKRRPKRAFASLARVRLTLVVTVADGVGNDRTVRRAVTLRR